MDYHKCWKLAAFRMYKYTQKVLMDVTSAYSPIGESACALATHTYQHPTYYFFLSCQFVPQRVSRDICDWRFRPYNTSPCLHTYYEWGTTGSFSSCVGRRLKRNRRTKPAGVVHVEAVQVAIAAVNVPNVSATIAEADRRQRPPISVCSIFL